MLPLALRPYFALFLLLCLTRTLLPEAWVLALHAHEHTRDEAVFRLPAKASGQALVSARHTHCQVEQFYDVPFQGALPVVVPRPRPVPAYQPLAVLAPLASSAAVLRRTALRGPPAA